MDGTFKIKPLPTRLVLLLLWAGFLLWVSLAPSPPTPSSGFLSSDKLQHALAYAVLTLLAGRFFSLCRPLHGFPWFLAFSAAVLYGGLIELLQDNLTEVRRAEWGDLVADATGGLVASAAAQFRVLRSWGKKSR